MYSIVASTAHCTPSRPPQLPITVPLVYIRPLPTIYTGTTPLVVPIVLLIIEVNSYSKFSYRDVYDIVHPTPPPIEY